MKYKTLRNMEKATAEIAKKGYRWNEANDIAIRCFDDSKQNGMSVEWFIDKIVPAQTAQQN